MAIAQRFSKVDKIKLVATGNSLVVCGSTTEPEINTSDLIKTDGTTTRDWTQAGSAATLEILENSTIIYAELVWYSTVFSNVSGALDVRSIQDSQITLTTSKGVNTITPKYKESYTSSSGSVDRYRAADVTEIVKEALGGSYSVSNVPISLPELGLSNTRAGWALVVIYRNDAFLPQKIIYSSGISVATPNTPLQTSIVGFTTSSDSKFLNGDITIIGANGGPLIGGEEVFIGPSFAQLNNIGNVVTTPNPNPGKAPNNSGNSFFSGVINVANPLSDSDGLLNISGTNGLKNNDGFVPTQLMGARNKWDITNVDISKTLVTNQTLLAGQITSGSLGDGIEIVGFGAEVSAKAPNMIVTLFSYDIDGDMEYNVEVDEAIAYAIQVKNDGDVQADNVIVSATVDSASSFIPGTVTINGVANTSENILNGINIGTVSAKGVVTVLFTVKVNSVPAGGSIYQNAKYSYEFVSGIETLSNTGTTNTIRVIVQEGILSIIKSVSNLDAHVGDNLTYTINIENTGTEIAKELFLQDKLDLTSSFINGSLSIDGKNFGNLNPVDGFALDNLAVGEKREIKFRAKIDNLPPSSMLENISCITFGYTFNQYGYLKKKTLFSNVTSVQGLFVEVIGERSSNNYYPKIGDNVTYTLTLTNIGNEDALNVQVLEPLIPGATFITDTVKVNGSLKTGLNPFLGFNLPDVINPKKTTTVQYQVVINKINPASLIENIAKIPFKYQITTGATVIDTEKDSNTVDTVANYVCMNITKDVDKKFATIGDTLYYSVKIRNSGNINAINTVFLDAIQKEASYIAGSVAINGISYPSYDPTKGFTLGAISPSDEFEVTFNARVISLPSPNVIKNKANLVYGYKPDPNGNTLSNTEFSNEVTTVINKAEYKVVKSVDKIYAEVGDLLVYTTVITNTGTVQLKNINFADFIGVFLKLVQGSVYIDGANYPDYNPTNQFLLGDLNPGEYYTVSFAAIIVSETSVGYIPNMSEAIISYQENPTSPIITKTAYSNLVKTYDPYANVTVVKAVDKSYAAVGDVLTYTFTVNNSGSSTAINTLFTDIIQAETSFVDDSVIVNGISKPSFNPATGFTLGEVVTGQVITVEFKARVDRLPNPNTIKNTGATTYSYYVDPNGQPVSKTATSNPVTTIINSYSAALTKSVDKTYATVGDVLDYTITLNNTGTVALTGINLVDAIPKGAIFVADSVIVDGTTIVGADPNKGFSINDVVPGGNTVIMFKATVTSIPTPPQIKNRASVTFKYKLTPTSSNIDGSLTSNYATTTINNMAVNNTKSVDKEYATLGNNLVYTSVISNNGSVELLNTNFVDSLDPDLLFVKGTVTINGRSYGDYDPNNGFELGTIAPGAKITVIFEAKVNTLPLTGFVHNISNMAYEYKIDPNSQAKKSNATSNEVTTYINYGDLTITKDKNIDIVRLTNIIKYSFVITNTGNTMLKNLFFKDIIQVESSFNTGTVYINGEQKGSYNPNVGFNVNDIPVGQQLKVEFEVTANSIPPQNKLLNTGDITYSYYVDPNGSPTTKSKTSNTTTVMVYDTIVSSTKVVSKTIAKRGDTLEYTVSIKNDGNVAAQFVEFEDILDSNLSFVINSVYVDGEQKPGLNPNNGFTLDDIQAGTTKVVKFSATIISRPADNVITNFATKNYMYYVGSDLISATITSNKVQTFVAVGELTITKSTNKKYSTVGEEFDYSVIVKNTGSVNATELKFKDLIPQGASFNGGTVTVNGIEQGSFDPNLGFNLTDLLPNQYHIITFSVTVNSVPPSGQLDNIADVTFTYRLTPSDEYVTVTTKSNIFIVYVKLGKLNITKDVDKKYATIGDVLNYSVNIENTGNEKCFKLFFHDLIQSDGTFVSGSVNVDGIPKPDFDPNVGFDLDDIDGEGRLEITFQVTVKTQPSNYNLNNFSAVDYKYYVDPTNAPIEKDSISNEVRTVINVGSLGVTKAVTKAYATIDDVLTYTVTVVNKGNVVAKNVNFRDVIPAGLTFVTGSVIINGDNQPTFNPYGSFTLGNINPGDTTVVSFDVKVTLVPSPSLISNTANVTFSYKINPNGADTSLQVDSNPVQTQINLGSLALTKSVDKDYATMGDVITYTVVVRNNGNVRSDNVIFSDVLQSDITFNTGSVKVNGKTEPSFDPAVGFSLGNIEAIDQVTVIFTVTVIDKANRGAVLNTASSSFSYKIDPIGQYYNKTQQSNPVYTFIIIPELAVNKLVDRAYATLQDILNYTVTVNNTGNTTISKGFFSDFLSNGGTFVVGSVVIDGKNYEGLDPITGFNLPYDLLPGEGIDIKFQARVMSIPTPPQITNYAVANGVYYVDPKGSSYPITAESTKVTTNVNVGSLSNTKTVDKMYAKLNDTINYTSTIINTGNVNATNLFFTDPLDSSLSFVSGTLSINDVVYPALDPVKGFSLSDLAPNQTVTVGFTAKINSLPAQSYVTNISNINFSYLIDPNGSVITKDQKSNDVTTNIVLGKLNVFKTVDKPIATIGDVLTYTVTLTNMGNVIDSEVLFQDTPSTGVKFKTGSVTVNGTGYLSYDPTVGFSLGDIGIGSVVTVKFTVEVISVPSTNQVTNQAVVLFKYLVDPKVPPYSDTAYSNTVITNIALGSLNVNKAVNKQYATIGEEITYTVTITNTGNINATNVVFLDPTPQNSIFVQGSVTINGTAYPDYNPSAGFDLNTMTPGQIITVVYKVQVTKLC